jgi:hypothetical protein
MLANSELHPGSVGEQEVCHGEAEVYPGVQEAARLIKERGVSYAQAAEDLGVMS